MLRKIMLTVMIVLNLFLLSSCIGTRGLDRLEKILPSEEAEMTERAEQIIPALENGDKDALKSVFSQKAVDEATDLDNDLDLLFDFVQGDIESWEIEHGWSSSESINYGKSSRMIRYTLAVVTDVDEYEIFLIDYSEDTIDPDNEGVYMLEVHKSSYDGEWESWENRMRAGISIVE